ncbi:extracellular solute-binding protein [soil metagenome]
MERVTLRGMTWDHRRAIDPLVETLPQFAERHPGITIEWSSRPLHGFEFTPVSELAKQHDFIVLDHPFCGDIADGRYLVPVEDIAGAPSDYAGVSLETYRYDGHVWALPIDAACQVAVSRPDLMESLGRSTPANWMELLDLGRAAKQRGLQLAIGLKGVHSLMTFFTLCANLGHPCSTERSLPLVHTDTAREALSLMRELLSYCAPQSLDWNSIALHDVMVSRDDLVFCPAVYCYATYAEADQRRRLRFHDFPGPRGAAGSTIGGTGLGISAHCRHPEAALAYGRFVVEAGTQFAFAHNHGQPARAEVWDDIGINARFGGCYRDTRRTIDACWIRPRYKGYLDFQAKAGPLIEEHLRGGMSEGGLLDEIGRLHGSA